MHDVGGPQAAFAAAGIAGRLPAWLPPGTCWSACAVSGRGHTAALLRYGDGLKTMSVFEEAGGASRTPPSARKCSAGKWRVTASRRGCAVDPLSASRFWGMPPCRTRWGRTCWRALAPDSEARLARGLPVTFAVARSWSAAASRLGLQQIAALRLFLRARPDQAGVVAARLRRGQGWPQIADGLHADAARLDDHARRWIATTLTAHRRL